MVNLPEDADTDEDADERVTRIALPILPSVKLKNEGKITTLTLEIKARNQKIYIQIYIQYIQNNKYISA